MKLAFISPTRYLERISIQGDIEFCLAHNALTSEEYRRYYKKQTGTKFTILDNGEHEGSQVSYEDLFFLAVELGVQEVIVPDSLYNGAETIEKAKEFLRTFGYDLTEPSIGKQLCLAVQGKDLTDWFPCFMYALKHPLISTIGLTFDIPFNVCNLKAPTKTLLQVQRRLELLEIIKETYIKTGKVKPVHLLGLSDPLELLFAKKYPFVRSNDSSSVVTHAMKNIKFLDKGLPGEKVEGHLDFNARIGRDRLKVVDYNIQKVKGLIR